MTTATALRTHYVTFKHKQDNVPEPHESSWAEFCAMLMAHRERASKDGPAFSPAIYRPKTTRGNENVESITMAVADLDEGFDWEVVKANLEGLEWIGWSTHSYTPENGKCRVAIPFAEPVPAAEWPELWQRINHGLFDGKMDQQRKDQAGIYYLPSHPPNSIYFTEHHEGAPLDPYSLEMVPESATPAANGAAGHAGAIPRIGREAADFIAFGAELGQQRGRALAAGRNLLAAGYTVGQVAEKLMQGFRNSPSDPAKEPWTEANALQIAQSLADSKPTPPRELEGIDLAPVLGVRRASPPSPLLGATVNGANGKVHAEDVEPPGGDAPPAEDRTDEEPRSFALTDLGNSERLVRRFGADLRYYPVAGKWLYWDGKRWREDTVGRIYRLAKQTVRLIYQEASEAESDARAKELAKHAIRSESKERIKAMVELAQSELPVEPADLDADCSLFNCLNGTLDLRTGLIREHRREDLITKLAPVAYDPAADCPTWRQFLATIMADQDGKPKRRLIAFLRRMLGYSMTAETSEQVIFLLWGGGSNGKSTFLETGRALLGDYAQQADFSTFLYRDYDRVSNDIARLKGCRFVSAVEVEGTRRLAETLVKQLTGGDTVTARYLFREFFEFTPAFKILLAANHKPTIRGSDWAIWRRIRLLPFTVTIAEGKQDKKLPEKLRRELPGILNWALRGCLLWQRKGLGMPDEVRQATADYRDEMDILGSFLADCCVIAEAERVLAKDLYQAYLKWAEQEGETAVKQTTFGIRLTERGIQRTRQAGTGKVEYRGIGLVKGSGPVNSSEGSPGQSPISQDSRVETPGDASQPFTEQQLFTEEADRHECADCGEAIKTNFERCVACETGIDTPSPLPCTVCRAPVPDGRNLYCSDACQDEDIPE
jgi:P4 family phage/plasmid primase-like protien